MLSNEEKVENISKWIVFHTNDPVGAIKIGEMLDDLLDEIYNSIHKDILIEKINKYKECIKGCKPDDLMLIDYYEDRVKFLEELIDEINETFIEYRGGEDDENS